MSLLKVLVVDDSDIIADVLTQALESDKKIKVVGRARNGREALQLVENLSPDLITMDVWMPVMDGFETVERIMADKPTPILVITSSRLQEDVQLSMRMLAAGALDVIEKPVLKDEASWQKHQRELVAKVRLLAGVKVITHLRGRTLHPPLPLNEPHPAKAVVNPPVAPTTLPKVVPPVPATRSTVTPMPQPTSVRPPLISITASFPPVSRYQVIAIASSTGGPTALLRIIQALPSNIPAALLIVQHISEGFTQGLVDWLQRESHLKIKMAQDGDVPQPGMVLLAPDRRDMLIGPGHRIMTSSNSTEILRPSANVMMRAVARAYGERSIGIVLTGMGSDGAEGLRAMAQAGAYTITQDETSSLIYGMPKAAMELTKPREILPLGLIAPRLVELCQEAADSTQLREG